MRARKLFIDRLPDHRAALACFAVWGLAFFSPAFLAAQSWKGSSNLGVQVRSTKGGAVSDATVEIRFRSSRGAAGPESRRTDSRGQANFVGLAEGRWSLEIKHPDFLSFVAAVDVKRNKKPEIVSQFLEAAGAGRGTFKVKFLRTDKALGAVIAGSATEAPKPPQRPVSAPAPKPDPKPEPAPPEPRVEGRSVPSVVIEPPAAPRPETPEPKDAVEVKAHDETTPLEAEPPVPEAPAETPAAELQADPPAEEEPEPEPAPEQAAPAEPEVPVAEAPVEVPAPTPAPPSVETPEPEPSEPMAAEPATSIPEPTPEPVPEPEPMPAEPPISSPEPSAAPPPAPSPEPEPEPKPVLEPVAPPEVAPQPEPEVAPTPVDAPSEDVAPVQMPTPAPPPAVAESLRSYGDRTCFDCKPGEWAVATSLATPPGDACRPTAERAVRRAMRDVSAVASDKLGDFSGPLAMDPTQFPLSLAAEAARNTLAPYLRTDTSCRLAAVVIPAGARFTGFRFEASDATGEGDCAGSEECSIGSARFVFSPGVARGLGASIVYTLFENTGAAERNGRLSAFFVPAPGWQP